MDMDISPLVTVRVANKNDTEAIQRCRFDVYSEQGYITPSDFPDGKEWDEFDNYSVSVIASASPNLNAVGTTRLVLANKGPLPIQDSRYHGVDISGANNPAEISRLCVRKRFRNGKISLGMYRTLLHIVEIEEVDRVYAVIDEDFFETLRWIGFPFSKIGAPVNYMGKTIPCMCDIKEVIPALRDNENANMLGITALFEQPFPGQLIM